MADVTRLIGIDFGTSTSLVRVKRYEGGKPIGGAVLSAGVTFGNGQDDIRALTVVRREGDGKVTCGREAEEPLPESAVYREFKMDLESPDEAKRAQARDLTGEFFKYLYRWYDHQRSNLGEAGDRERTVVSFPVKWSAETRDFMVQAAKDAGFPEVTSMDEASAALSATLVNKMNDVKAMGYLRPGEPGTMLLIDMGAGTTDLAVCRYSVDGAPDGVVQVGRIRNEIVATWPESADAPTFGGREVDELLAGYLTDYLCACGLDASMAGQLVRGTGAVRPWKEHSVSALLAEDKSVASCGFLAGYMMLLPRKMPFPAIDRAGFEALVHDKLEDFKSLITGCLDRAAQLDPAIAERGVDLVVLTGGHSSWYFTKDLLTGAMPGLTHPALKQVRSEPDRVLRLPNPQETVSLGLVYSLLPLKMEKETPPKPKKAAPAPAPEPPKTNDEFFQEAKRFVDDWVREKITFYKKEWNDVMTTMHWHDETFPKYTYSITMTEDWIQFVENGKRGRMPDISLGWNDFVSGKLFWPKGRPNTLCLKKKGGNGAAEMVLYDSSLVFTDQPWFIEVPSFILLLQRRLQGKGRWHPPTHDIPVISGGVSPSLNRKIGEFIAANAPRSALFKYDAPLLAQFRQNLKIPGDSKILLAYMHGPDSNPAKKGWALTQDGIYEGSVGFLGSSRKINWENLISGEGMRLYYLFSTTAYYPLELSLDMPHRFANVEAWTELVDFLLALRDYIRELAAS